MEKFSLFDFVSFILPGGTFLIIIYLLFSGLDIHWIPTEIPDISVIVIPFLVVAYLAGHMISLFGNKIEKTILNNECPWMKYLENNPSDTLAINSLCIKLFEEGFFNDENKVDIVKSDKLYDKISDYIEVNEKDKKINILMSQYGFFKNTTALWSIIFFNIIIFIILHLTGIVTLTYPVYILISSAAITFLFTVFSSILRKKRKQRLMEFVYRTFHTMNIKPKNI